MFLVHDLELVAGYHPDSCRTGIPPRDDLYWRREERMLFNTTKMEKGCAVRAVRVRGRALTLKHGEWNILELSQRQRQVDPWELDQDQLRCL